MDDREVEQLNLLLRQRRQRQAAARDPVEALDLAERIKPLLHGRPPEVQGAALCELLSLWLAGHHQSQREELLALHIKTVWELVAVNAPPLDARREELSR